MPTHARYTAALRGSGGNGNAGLDTRANTPYPHPTTPPPLPPSPHPPAIRRHTLYTAASPPEGRECREERRGARGRDRGGGVGADVQGHMGSEVDREGGGGGLECGAPGQVTTLPPAPPHRCRAQQNTQHCNALAGGIPKPKGAPWVSQAVPERITAVHRIYPGGGPSGCPGKSPRRSPGDTREYPG
jgi:hypothetical protein